MARLGAPHPREVALTFKRVATGTLTTCVLGADGQIRFAGYGAYGSLGGGSNADAKSFTLVTAPQ